MSDETRERIWYTGGVVSLFGYYGFENVGETVDTLTALLISEFGDGHEFCKSPKMVDPRVPDVPPPPSPWKPPNAKAIGKMKAVAFRNVTSEPIKRVWTDVGRFGITVYRANDLNQSNLHGDDEWIVLLIYRGRDFVGIMNDDHSRYCDFLLKSYRELDAKYLMAADNGPLSRLAAQSKYPLHKLLTIFQIMPLAEIGGIPEEYTRLVDLTVENRPSVEVSDDLCVVKVGQYFNGLVDHHHYSAVADALGLICPWDL